MEKKDPRAAAQVVAAIEEDVLSGKLRPGERVDEASLAKSFRVSRTPVNGMRLRPCALRLGHCGCGAPRKRLAAGPSR